MAGQNMPDDVEPDADMPSKERRFSMDEGPAAEPEGADEGMTDSPAAAPMKQRMAGPPPDGAGPLAAALAQGASMLTPDEMQLLQLSIDPDVAAILVKLMGPETESFWAGLANTNDDENAQMGISPTGNMAPPPAMPPAGGAPAGGAPPPAAAPAGPPAAAAPPPPTNRPAPPGGAPQKRRAIDEVEA